VREGVLAVTRDEATLDRLEGVIRELQLDDELSIADTPDLALHRIRSGLAPRIVLLDLTDLPAPIAEIGAVRAMGGADLALVGLGTVNDVTLYRDLLAAGANDWSSRLAVMPWRLSYKIKPEARRRRAMAASAR